MQQDSLWVIALIGVLGFACQWLAWWIKLPAILLLLLVGLILGPMTGLIQPTQLLGHLYFPLVSLSVAVILFEGSLTLKFSEIRGLAHIVRNLIGMGLCLTWLLIAAICHFVVGFAWPLALLFGAMTAITGPTVIIPMLRTVRPTARVANILRWEGITIDPLGALLAVIVFGFIMASHEQVHPGFGWLVISTGKVIIVGLVFGMLAGYGLAKLLHRHYLPEYLHNVAALVTVVTVFALANVVHEESGLLTVTVMGIFMANYKDLDVQQVLGFKESLSVLLISNLFILLAANITVLHLRELWWPALILVLAIQFVISPLKVFVCSLGSDLSWREKAILAWITPRGIVTAAMAALFALRFEQNNIKNAELLVPLTYLVIIGTVVLQSLTARSLAQWLRVAEPEPRGFLIVGAGKFAQAIALALESQGFRVLITSMTWQLISHARMQGLTTYFGNAVSREADRSLDLVGIGQLLALSPQTDLNALACLRYRGEFGSNKVFYLQTEITKESHTDKYQQAWQQAGHILFGKDITYTDVAQRFNQGGEVKVSQLSDNYLFDDFCAQYGKRAIPLFAIDIRDRLHVFTADANFRPQAGWKVISMLGPEAYED